MTIAILGNGIIGHGMADVFAKAGHAVRLIGRSEASLAAALARIRDSMTVFAAEGLFDAAQIEPAMARISTGTDLAAAQGCDFVFEAVPEDMELKLSLFERLDAMLPPSAILASSSGHPASALAVRMTHRARMVAAHFWYPPQLLPLVEVCGGPETAPEVVERTVALLRAAGKEPVVIAQEVPGFIGNRIQFAALREAWSLWARGVASAEAIDAVVRHSIGRRLGVTGPIESADLGGLDTMWHFARFLQPDLNADPLPPEAIGRLVEQGARGVANGRGLHDWSRRDGAALAEARRRELIRWLKADQAR
jgi:3-hydroxybutyryl-CoA dehydrogenase